MKITEQQVKDCYENKELLKELFPEAFKVKHEIGKWYKYKTYLILILDENNWCGFADGFWHEKVSCQGIIYDEDFAPSTREEVEKALIAEAEKRGLLELGIKVKSAWSGKVRKNKKINLVYIYEDNNLVSNYGSEEKVSVSLFYQGKWAEIIQEKEIELTLDQIAEKFGVDKVKIKKD